MENALNSNPVDPQRTAVQEHTLTRTDGEVNENIDLNSTNIIQIMIDNMIKTYRMKYEIRLGDYCIVLS